MKIAVAVAAGLVSAMLCAPALADDAVCKPLGVLGAAVLQQCGDQLHSFALDLSDPRREVTNDQEGRFSFDCPVSLMCIGSPTISGYFVDPDKWNKGAKDAPAIAQINQDSPVTAENPAVPPPTSAPAAACPLFDVTIGEASGKGACFNDAATKTSTVAMVLTSGEVGFLLNFSQKGIAADKLKDAVTATLPKFKIERARGDVGLLRWMR
jgi:hypothetical protein